MSRAQTRRPHQISSDVHKAFDIQDVLSESAYRAVYSAVHRSSNANVVIKVLRPFDHFTLCMRTLNEVKLLQHFEHPNIISILDIKKPRDHSSFAEIYVVQELMDTDLRKVIQTLEVSDDHCQYFIWQALCALDALHSAGVIHRDLTPSNLLLNQNCDLKIGDLSLARSAARVMAEQGSTREYITALWYRAPEIMLAFERYTYAIDIWSIGCILAEMLNGKPVFPGRDSRHQLSLIFDVLGTPTKEDTKWIDSEPIRVEIHSLPFREKIPWQEMLPRASAVAIHFVEKLLTLDPYKRINVKEALQHPYLKAYHDQNSEPVGAPIPPEFFAFDKGKGDLNKEQLERLIYDEIMQ